MNILVTGCAGFLGFHFCIKMLKLKHNIIGIDNLNSYYDIKLKKSRLNILKKYKNFSFSKVDLQNKNKLLKIFKKKKFEYVCNLAAQAGIRYSLKYPEQYLKSNIVGYFNLLELSKDKKIKHFIYASSSSVYGLNKKIPFSTKDEVNHPINFYAVSKRFNELAAHSYSHLYSLPTTGIRFFTLYGPWGRPDMALFSFFKNIYNKKKIKLFNYGNQKRDFTFIDDARDFLIKVIKKPPKKRKIITFTPDVSSAPYRVLNCGASKPTSLKNFVALIENSTKLKFKKQYLPLLDGEIVNTFANMKSNTLKIKNKKNTEMKKGVESFKNWYLDYFKINAKKLK